jgi:hypothetical protein
MMAGWRSCQKILSSKIQGVNSTRVGLSVSAGALGIFVVQDYVSWKSFGVGGSPPNPFGYLRSHLVGMFNFLTLYDRRNVSSLSATSTPRYIYEKDLPARQGLPVKIRYPPLPHRQVPETLAPEQNDLVMQKLSCIIPNIASSRPDLFEIRPSDAEGGSTDALYARADIPKLNPIAQKPFYTIDREIAHVHPQDRSLHVWLSDADAKAVVEKGCGERFVVKFAPSGYVMVYAPRNEDEVKILEKIVKVGAIWFAGVEL